ncbi:MAG: DUF1611 domain-containing protein [Acidimicrobiia bacterium]|nr:DUF1611 domain-containing protein [Acidimicrobiia bacterium]MDH5294575.1 DUF1611 domain-containing protein [Acidimicrobiia bacterium]
MPALRRLISGAVRPRAGDLVLARVDRLGNHRRLELTDGRRASLYLGDEIVVVYANRYASDQFESYVPYDLGPTELVASGGIASAVKTKSADVRTATSITPLGLLSEDGVWPLNVSDYALGPVTPPSPRPRNLVVLGTAMNSGKTTTINRLVRGLVAAGHRPGVTKVTGTGSGGDYWVMLDAGAHAMLDFTDAGHGSTFLADLAEVESTMALLTDHIAASGAGSILVEVADGLLQRETAHLLDSESFRERVDGIVFAAADSMGAIAGVSRLRSLGLPVVAIAGRITRSPLATEEASRVCGLPILNLAELEDPEVASSLLGLELQSGRSNVVVDLTRAGQPLTLGVERGSG